MFDSLSFAPPLTYNFGATSDTSLTGKTCPPPNPDSLQPPGFGPVGFGHSARQSDQRQLPPFSAGHSITAIRATFRRGETATDGPVAGGAGTSGSSGRGGPSGPPRPYGLPVWAPAGQGTSPGLGSFHNMASSKTTSLPNAQEGGPPFSKGADTPVCSFRVMGMRRVSVPESINQSEIVSQGQR